MQLMGRNIDHEVTTKLIDAFRLTIPGIDRKIIRQRFGFALEIGDFITFKIVKVEKKKQ